MLTAIAVIIVISGILAFKTHYKGAPHNYYYCHTIGGATTGTCFGAIAFAIENLSSTQLPGFAQFTTYATLVTPITTPCTIGEVPKGDCVSPLYAFGLGQ